MSYSDTQIFCSKSSTKLLTFASVLEFQWVRHLTIPVPRVKYLLSRVVCQHAVVSELVDKPYARISSLSSGCIIGVIDGCFGITIAVECVYNTARDKRIPQAFHWLCMKKAKCVHVCKGQWVQLRSAQLAITDRNI